MPGELIDGRKHIASWMKNNLPYYRSQLNGEAHGIITSLSDNNNVVNEELAKRIDIFVKIKAEVDQIDDI